MRAPTVEQVPPHAHPHLPFPRHGDARRLAPMKRLILCLALALSLLPATARAQVEASIQIGLPVAPPLVVVQPGIQVVENQDEEVFFVGGWYWCRRGDYWYRGRGPNASFMYVEPQRVPYRLAYLPPPGHYRHWRREQLREERHWWKEHDMERRRAWKEHEGAERHGWRAEGGPSRGPGRGPAPSRGGPAFAPGRGGPAFAPAPGRGGPAPAPAPGRGGHGDNSHGHDSHGH
jgi:hypothetical protein